VAAAWLEDAVDRFVDDQPILILERRGHAQTFDASDLDAERHDQHRIDRGRDKRLHPRPQFFFHLLEADAGAREPRVLPTRKRRGRQRLGIYSLRYSLSRLV